MTTQPRFAFCLSSAGRRVELLQCLRTAAASLGFEPLALAVDLSPGLSAACARADAAQAVPRADALGYSEALLRFCAAHGARIVVPTIDTELPILASEAARFAASGVNVVISSPEAVSIARDKLRTAAVLSDAGVPTPATASLAEVLAGDADMPFPMVLKRIDGSRSIGLHYAESIAAARALDLKVRAYVAQERCIGAEYTVNCYVDHCGVLRASVPHRRIEVRDGEVSKGITERRADLAAIARLVVKAIPGLRGPFCFQAILTASGPKVFEINARFGGGYPIAHAAGATFAQWLIEEALSLPCTANDEWQDGLLMLRYDGAVFLNHQQKNTP
jgi:carbamoyl-phosphate synthase large subunit